MGIFSLFRRKESSADRHRMGVRFDPKWIDRDVRRLVKKHIYASPLIPPTRRRYAYQLALTSVTRGRDLKYLSAGLCEIGLPKAVAANFAMEINNKTTTLMRVKRETGLGITHAKWVHSGTPCFAEVGSITKPGYEIAAEEHRKANGQTFSLGKGLLINGVLTWPGFDSGCRCTWSSIVPSFDN